MTLVSKEIVELKDPYGYVGYGNANGFFITIENDNVSIYSVVECRVTFEWHRKRACEKDTSKKQFNNRVAFLKRDMNLELMTEFWNQIFDKLGRRATKFQFKKTNFNNLIIIDLPEFWNANDTVQSLFSLLLRCSAVHYTGGEIWPALESYKLSRLVVRAIKHFLKGNTKPTYPILTKLDREGYTGFVAEFQELTNEEIATKLVAPSNVKNIS